MWVNNISLDFPEAKKAFESVDSVFALEGEPITTSSLCSVVKVVLDGQGYYVKRYRRGGEGLAEFVGISKARREWQNLLRFRDWGLAAAELAAYGEDSALTVPRRGVVITREICGSNDLASLANSGDARFSNAAWLAAVCSQVAEATRVMHEHNFAHNDWKWRNILVVDHDSVSPSDNVNVHLIDCPAGMTWSWPLFEYRRIKDLACLDKVGVKVLSKTRRLRFYLQYVQRSQLTAADKQTIRKIVNFFKGRE